MISFKPTVLPSMSPVTPELSNSPSSSPATLDVISTCIRVTTGTGRWDGGYLDVLVDVGSGYFEVTTGSINYPKGQVVIDECYSGLLGVQVTNSQTNAWAGSIESSLNNGGSYSPMKCIDCTGTVDTTEYIVVDGDDNGSGDTKCLNGIGGNACTLENLATHQPRSEVSYHCYF